MAGYQAIPKAKDLLDYAMQRTQTKASDPGKPHFPKSQTFYYCKALWDAALVILEQVQASAFIDKVVQHALVDNLVYDRITRSFIKDNSASQNGKGTHYGLDWRKRFMTNYWNKTARQMAGY